MCRTKKQETWAKTILNKKNYERNKLMKKKENINAFFLEKYELSKNIVFLPLDIPRQKKRKCFQRVLFHKHSGDVKWGSGRCNILRKLYVTIVYILWPNKAIYTVFIVCRYCEYKERTCNNCVLIHVTFLCFSVLIFIFFLSLYFFSLL